MAVRNDPAHAERPSLDHGPRPSVQESAEHANDQFAAAHAAKERVEARRAQYESVVVRREIRRAQMEIDEAAEIKREQDRVEADADAEFMRRQILPMLEDGWSLEQLAGIGVTREMLVSLRLLRHVRERPPESERSP